MMAASGKAGDDRERRWEVYDGRRRRPGDATVRVYRSCQVSFSSAAWRQLGEPEAIVFLTDRAEGKIAFRPARRGDRNAYSVSRPGHGVSAVALLRFMAPVPDGRYDLITSDGLPPHIDLGARR